MERIKALVVVYNIRLDECLTLSTIRNAPDVDIYVADNSTRDMGNKALAEQAGYRYVDMGGNKGLSRAYNAVIDGLEKDDSLICLFDDDTAVDGRYFDVLRTQASTHEGISLFAPVVKDARGILSPCVFKGLRGRRVNALSELPDGGVSVINSGLAIRLKVFGNYRYDERLFLDFVDHAFIRDAAGWKLSNISIIDVVLAQRFSGTETRSKAKARERFEKFEQDARVFGEKIQLAKWRVRLFVLIMRGKLWLKYSLRGGKQ